MKHRKLVPFLYYGIIFSVPSALSVFMLLYSGSWILALLTVFPTLDMALVRAKFLTDTLNKEKPYHRMFEKFCTFAKLFLPLAEVLILVLSPVLGGGMYGIGIVSGAIFTPFFTAVFAEVTRRMGFGKKSDLKIRDTFLSSVRAVLSLPRRAAKSFRKCIWIILNFIFRGKTA